VSTGDHHSAYLAKTVAALTPAGRERVDELLEQLVEVAGGRERLVRFAAARKSEADLGRTDVEPERPLAEQELNALLGGFMRIRDQEHLDDVADWANAVIALLEDELHAARKRAG
jgi:chorismate mutase